MGTKKIESNMFIVQNLITSVEIISNMTFETFLSKDSMRDNILPIQPTLRVNFSQGVQTLSNKTYEIRVYQYANISQLIENANQQNISGSIDSTINTQISSDASLSQSSAAALSSMWKAVSNGGKIIRNTQRAALNLQQTFSLPSENLQYDHVSQKYYVICLFSDLSISFNSYGKYQLIAVIDGIESALSDPFTISPRKSTMNSVNFLYFIVFQLS